MSAASLGQLRESYERVVEATLRRVRDSGLLRGPGSREAADELGTLWRAAIAREVQDMRVKVEGAEAAAKPLRRPAPLLEAGSLFAGPSTLPAALTRSVSAPLRVMDGVSFADDHALPSPPPVEALPPSLRTAGGFAASQVDIEDDRRPAAARARDGRSPPPRAGGPARKRARVAPLADAPSQAKDSGSSAPAPKAQAAASAVQAAAAPAAAATVDSDDEYGGCFEGAEVVVAAEPVKEEAVVTAGSPGRGEAAAAIDESSEGSALGSDLDDSEFDEPETDNVLTGEITKIQRTRKKWSVWMRHGVLQADGAECLFSSAHCVFEVDDESSLQLEDVAGVSGVTEDGIDG